MPERVNYSIRLGELKPQLEMKAHEKKIKLPELIRGILSDYLEGNDIVIKAERLNIPFTRSLRKG